MQTLQKQPAGLKTLSPLLSLKNCDAISLYLLKKPSVQFFFITFATIFA